MMTIINSRKNVFVLFLTTILSFAVLIIESATFLPLPSYADRIFVITQGSTLALGCGLDDDFIATTKVFKYDQPNKLIFNCDRSGGDVDLKKGESVSIRCLHDNPLTIARDVKMKLGDLFYIICK